MAIKGADPRPSGIPGPAVPSATPSLKGPRWNTAYWPGTDGAVTSSPRAMAAAVLVLDLSRTAGVSRALRRKVHVPTACMTERERERD